MNCESGQDLSFSSDQPLNPLYPCLIPPAPKQFPYQYNLDKTAACY